MNYYRFSPIKTDENLREVWKYLVSELGKLSQKVTGTSLKITTLKIFAHFPDEYDYLYKTISSKGYRAPFNSSTSFYVNVNEKIESSDIKYLGVRVVDPYRLHVGCGDFEVEDFEIFNKEFIGKSPYIREVKDDMVELWHPDFDVLGYVIPKD